MADQGALETHFEQANELWVPTQGAPLVLRRQDLNFYKTEALVTLGSSAGLAGATALAMNDKPVSALAVGWVSAIGGLVSAWSAIRKSNWNTRTETVYVEHGNLVIDIQKPKGPTPAAEAPPQIEDKRVVHVDFRNTKSTPAIIVPQVPEEQHDPLPLSLDTHPEYAGPMENHDKSYDNSETRWLPLGELRVETRGDFIYIQSKKSAMRLGEGFYYSPQRLEQIAGLVRSLDRFYANGMDEALIVPLAHKLPMNDDDPHLPDNRRTL